MSLDPHKAVLIAYPKLDFCNPLSPSLLDRVLATAALCRLVRGRTAGAGAALDDGNHTVRRGCARPVPPSVAQCRGTPALHIPRPAVSLSTRSEPCRGPSDAGARGAAAGTAASPMRTSPNGAAAASR